MHNLKNDMLYSYSDDILKLFVSEMYYHGGSFRISLFVYTIGCPDISAVTASGVIMHKVANTK